MTSKVAVVNLNVGSAIEYAGDLIDGWTRELDYTVETYKEQTEAGDLMLWLEGYKPDMIVINEDYHRPHVATYLHRKLRDVHVPLIYINHCWNRVVDWAEADLPNKYEEWIQMWFRHTLDSADYIFCLNQKPLTIEWPKRVRYKISNRYYPTDPDLFKVTRRWADRTKMFCYIGNIIPHKLSQDFLAKIRGTDLVVDCYGRDYEEEDKYEQVFEDAIQDGNIRYYGLVRQEVVPEVMNQYKYFVMPHDGYEPFNWVLKQCMYCGTIPLIVNDRDTHLYNGKWLDWAAGLYMGCKYNDEFITNLQRLESEQPDHSDMSNYISKSSGVMFPYQEFKEEYQNKVRELLTWRGY